MQGRAAFDEVIFWSLPHPKAAPGYTETRTLITLIVQKKYDRNSPQPYRFYTNSQSAGAAPPAETVAQ